jgi:tetratricopeptide (TPR) repeat protein
VPAGPCGRAVLDHGRYAEAKPLYKRALAIGEKALNPNDVDIGDHLRNLGLLYHLQDRYAVAEAIYKRALAIRETAIGRDHPDVAYVLRQPRRVSSRATRLSAGASNVDSQVRISERGMGVGCLTPRARS